MKISRLEQIRDELGLNKTQFAEAMGISPHHYYGILSEKNKAGLRVEHLEGLLEHLGINPIWILTGEGNKLIDPHGKITPEMLLASITEHLPPGWQDQWYAPVFPQVCTTTLEQNPDAKFNQLQVAALQACVVVITQMTTLINESTEQGYGLTLNYGGHTYTFPAKPSK
jgi:transcriptional regulator with XRE-family HTH domain